MAIYQGVFLFAVGIGPLPGGYLAEQFGLDVPFLVYGVASLVAALVAWFGVSETRGLDHQAPDSALHALDMRGQFRMLAGNVGFLLVCLIGLTNAVARTGALFSIVPVLARDRLALTATEIGSDSPWGSINRGLPLPIPRVP